MNTTDATLAYDAIKSATAALETCYRATGKAIDAKSSAEVIALFAMHAHYARQKLARARICYKAREFKARHYAEKVHERAAEVRDDLATGELA